jgi:hypothetical protein
MDDALFPKELFITERFARAGFGGFRNRLRRHFRWLVYERFLAFLVSNGDPEF